MQKKKVMQIKMISWILMYTLIFMMMPINNNMIYAVMEDENIEVSEVVTPDTTPPVINFFETKVEVVQGSVYTMDEAKKDVTAIDDRDGDITANVVADVVGVNTKVLGEYTVTYYVSDSAGNFAKPKIRKVRVIEGPKPVITLNGDAVINIQKGDSYVEQGAAALDSKGVDLASEDVDIFGNVDVSREGIYQIKYNITDSYEKVAKEVIRTVNVIGEYQRLGYAIGQVPSNRKNFKYYIGKNSEGETICMLVSKLGINLNFGKSDILGSDNEFLQGIYYIDIDGIIKRYDY